MKAPFVQLLLDSKLLSKFINTYLIVGQNSSWASTRPTLSLSTGTERLPTLKKKEVGRGGRKKFKKFIKCYFLITQTLLMPVK